MRKLALLVCLLLASASAKVTSDASPRWIIITPDFLPINADETNIAPWVDGYMIRVDAADNSVGQVATDTTCNTNCTIAPITQTNDFTTLDTDAKAFAALTCAASLRGVGHPCYVNFTLRGMSNPNANFNVDTPQWVFSQAWATTVGAPVLDAAFCSSYPSNPAGINPLPPVTGTANINSTNCGSGSTQCTLASVSAGVPAYWYQTMLAFKRGWLLQFFTYLQTATYLSQVKYVSVAIGTGDENTVTCGTIAGSAGTGLEFLVSPQTDNGLKTAMLGGITNFVTYANTIRQSLGLNFTLIGRFSMGVGLTNGTSTDPTWSIAEAAIPAQFLNFGIGQNGLKNGQAAAGGSDMLNIVGAISTCVNAANSPNCTSNNFSNTLPTVHNATYIIGQESNVSDPAGGTVHILDASLSGTGVQADTLWQFFSLAGAAGFNVVELAPKEAKCFGNITPVLPCASGNAIQLAYQAAAIAWAKGQIPITH